MYPYTDYSDIKVEEVNEEDEFEYEHEPGFSQPPDLNVKRVVKDGFEVCFEKSTTKERNSWCKNRF